MARLALALLAACFGATIAAAADRWLPVREVSMEVQSGSPLDLSLLLPNAVIGPESAFGTPQHPVRRLCASLAWSPASGGFPAHDEADRYARQLAMRGYDIARLVFLDAALMFGRGRDFDFDPETLDRIHYLLAALKRNGIRWMIDATTSWRGAYGGHDDRWDPAGEFKLALHFDDAAFSHWKRLQKEFLARVNPYTGKAPLDDEALALVILANENGIEFESVVHERPGRPAYPPLLAAPFNRWLAARYGSTRALARAWGDLAHDERLEDKTVRLPHDRYGDGPRMRDVQEFFVDAEQGTAARMTAALRDLGYRGPVSSYNNWPTVQASLSRTGLDVVTANTYHDWASGYEPGSRLTQESAISDDAAYIRVAAAARWLGKPFVISEWDHLFWNRHRYEAGLMMPAYAALQGWDALCRHGHGPVVLRYGEPFPHKRAMLPYAIALDPVARAGETLAALLFRRGDVAQAGLTVPFAMRGAADLGPDMQAQEPDALTRFALLGRIGLGDEADAKAMGGAFVPQPRAAADPMASLDALRKSGALPADNRTAPRQGVYESATGEIVLDSGRGQFRVVTPATEGAAWSGLRAPLDLGLVSIRAANVDGMLALSALDEGASLRAARRILLVFATDARNTAMRFRDRQERVIEDFGRLPVLLRAGTADVELAREGRWRLSPVGLDGHVHAPVDRGEGRIGFRLDNDAPSGPTTFFLLEID
jgi:hypothetical protein